MKVLKYLSLFTGGFGLDLGIENVTSKAYKFKNVGCIDNNIACRETIKHNRPHLKVLGESPDECDGDLFQLSTDLILKKVEVKVRELSLIVGGPPCQSWSILGRRKGFEDERGELMYEYVRVVREAQPKAFILENVVGFHNHGKGEAYKQVVAALANANYPSVSTWLLDAADFGVPQFRRRVFVVGFRDDLNVPNDLPAPPRSFRSRSENQQLLLGDTSLQLHRTVQQAFHDIPDDAANHEPRIHGERVSTRYSSLKPGERDKVDHTDRLVWNEPSGTVLVGSQGGGGRPFIHPELPRHLTVREAARLQGFPDEWVFCGNSTAQYRQVGNAVPPALAEAVVREIVPYLLK